ncbi:hypothetical protein [Phaffia rhodozyma]|uniref:Uncharacterized protein n=1 Tax=Phaffia rhodozyma TaxID=264483 RepID=A0A0F7SEP8_PHARH|nr:hypothetical protein [Phaffia rhodozyma]
MSKTGRTFSSASSERPHFQHPALQALQDEGADDEGASQYSLFSSTSGDLVSHNGSHLGRQRESGSGTPSEVPASGARRFSTTHSTHPPVLAPASYSATQSSIRNSTARLADFAARPLHSTSASDYRIDSTPSSPANHSMFASTRHYSDTQATGVDRSSDVNKDLAQLGLSQKHQPGTSPGGTGPSGLALMLQSNSPPASGLDDTTSPGMAIQIDPPREEDEADEREDDWSPSTSVTPKASKMTVLPEPKSSSYRKGSALSALVERDQETSRGSRLAPSDIVEEDSDISNTTEASSSGKKLSTSSVAAGNQGGNERTHLLARHDEHAQDSSNGLTETDPESFGKNRESGLVGWWREMSTGWEKPTGKTLVENCVVAPTKALPAVMLGLLLNLLDGVSYDESSFSSHILSFDLTRLS